MSELGMTVIGTLWRALPILGNHVPHVVEVGSEKQVIGVDAWLNIASMANHHPGGDRSILHGPRKPMRSYILSFAYNLAVPPGVIRAHPYPAPAFGDRDNIFVQIENRLSHCAPPSSGRAALFVQLVNGELPGGLPKRDAAERTGGREGEDARAGLGAHRQRRSGGAS